MPGEDLSRELARAETRRAGATGTCGGSGRVIANVRRGSRRVNPHGETALQFGDVLTFVIEAKDSGAVRQLCERKVGEQ